MLLCENRSPAPRAGLAGSVAITPLIKIYCENHPPAPRAALEPCGLCCYYTAKKDLLRKSFPGSPDCFGGPAGRGFYENLIES